MLIPEVDHLERRLFLTADLMLVTGKERAIIERTLAAALSLAAPRLRNRHHPFLNRLAQDSIDIAREALAEGYDMRSHDGEGDWE